MTEMADEWKRLGFKQSHSNGRRYWVGCKLKEITDMREEEKEYIITNGEASTPSTIASTIPSGWYISETQKQ
jgi:hypothetical protein